MSLVTWLCFFLFVRVPTLLALLWRKRICRGLKPAIRNRRSPSIIVFRLDALGDVVLTTPLFRELKRRYPESQCTVVVQPAYASLLTTNPQIDRVLAMPLPKIPWVPQMAGRLTSALLFWHQQLRKKSFDIAISPRWDVDEHLATFLCLVTKASVRIGYTEHTSPAKQALNRAFERAFDLCLSAGSAEHEVKRNLRIVEALDGTAEDCQLEIRLSDQDRKAAGERLRNIGRGAKLVALGLGAQTVGRRWPLARYAQTILELHKSFPVQLVIVCALTEQGDAARLAGLLPGKPLIMAGAPLREVCAVLELCNLFIGNDSGPAHLAAAMRCNTIVISRHPHNGDPNHPNSPMRFAPFFAGSRVLQPAKGHGGCTSCCLHNEPHCIWGVTVQQVVDAARSMLLSDEPLNEVGPVLECALPLPAEISLAGTSLKAQSLQSL